MGKMNSNNERNLNHSILIKHLPASSLEDAIKSVTKLALISEQSISQISWDPWGAKMILKDDQNFFKVLSLNTLCIQDKTYSLYSLVTDLIVYGTEVHMSVLKMQLLLRRFAPVLFIDKMKNPDGTDVGNFRATLYHPEIPDEIKVWTRDELKITENIKFTLSSFCPFCSVSGHFKGECGKRQMPNTSFLQSNCLPVYGRSNSLNINDNDKQKKRKLTPDSDQEQKTNLKKCRNSSYSSPNPCSQKQVPPLGNTGTTQALRDVLYRGSQNEAEIQPFLANKPEISNFSSLPNGQVQDRQSTKFISSNSSSGSVSADRDHSDKAEKAKFEVISPKPFSRSTSLVQPILSSFRYNIKAKNLSSHSNFRVEDRQMEAFSRRDDSSLKKKVCKKVSERKKKLTFKVTSQHPSSRAAIPMQPTAFTFQKSNETSNIPSLDYSDGSSVKSDICRDSSNRDNKKAFLESSPRFLSRSTSLNLSIPSTIQSNIKTSNSPPVPIGKVEDTQIELVAYSLSDDSSIKRDKYGNGSDSNNKASFDESLPKPLSDSINPSQPISSENRNVIKTPYIPSNSNFKDKKRKSKVKVKGVKVVDSPYKGAESVKSDCSRNDSDMNKKMIIGVTSPMSLSRPINLIQPIASTIQNNIENSIVSSPLQCKQLTPSASSNSSDSSVTKDACRNDSDKEKKELFRKNSKKDMSHKKRLPKIRNNIRIPNVLNSGIHTTALSSTNYGAVPIKSDNILESGSPEMNEKVAYGASSPTRTTNLIHVIPPTVQKDIGALKLFFSRCKSFKQVYKSALRYPAGVGTLLRQLRKIIKFNRDVATKSKEEIKFITWICFLLSKLQYLHLKRNVPFEPFYEIPLLEIVEVE